MNAFSNSQEAGQGVAPCDETIIPILPMRYQLTGDKLVNMTKDGSVAALAPGITSHPDHDLMRIRQGFVFILAEDHVEPSSDPARRWQIFRYTTNGEDENSQISRPDTDIGSHGSAYSFKKYNWADGTVDGKWEILPTERAYPYAFVSDQVSKVWVAYSEYRWPSWFFTKAETDVAFRNKIMTEADVAGRSGTHAAPLSDLATLSPAFYEGDPPASSANDLGNAMRQTGVVAAPMSSVARCLNSRTNGVVIGLYDPIGEHLDLGMTAFNIAETKRNYLAEHQYPMAIGQHVRQIRRMENADWEGGLTNRVLSNIGLGDWGGFDEDVLTAGFDRVLTRIESKVRDFNETERTFFRAITRMEGRTGFGSVLDLLTVTRTEAEARSGTEKEDLCAFAMHVFSRSQSMLGACETGSQHMMSTLDGTGPGIAAETQKVLKIVKELVEGVRQLHDAFVPAFNGVLTVYGKEWALSSIRPDIGAPEITAINLVMFEKRLGSFTSADDMSDAFQGIMRQEWGGGGYGGNAQIRPILGGQALTFDVGPNAPREVGAYMFTAQVDFLASPETLQATRRARMADLTGNGVGAVAGFLSLYSTISNYEAPNRNTLGIARAAQDPRTQIIAAFADAVSSVNGLRQFAATRSMASSQVALRAMFGSSPSLTNAVRVAPASGSIAARMVRLIGRAAVVIGIAMSGIMMAEGFARGDMKMAIGNALMLIGSVAILFATGIGAVIAVAIIIVGFIITLFSNSDGENWIKRGFWGTSGQYWGDTRDTLDVRLQDASVLAYPGEANYRAIRQAFDDELAEFVDMFSTLQILNPVAGNGQLEIHCGVINTPADLGRMTVRAEYFGYRMRNTAAQLSGPVFVAPGVARISVAVPAGTVMADWARVNVAVELPRVPNGEFSEYESFTPEAV